MSKMYEALKMAQEQGVALEVPELLLPERDVPETPAPEAGLDEDYDKFEETYRSALADDESDQWNSVRRFPLRVRGDFALVPWNALASPGGEQYRIVRTRIVQHPSQPRVMVVSSACAGDGKTVSAINIAGVLSLRDNTNVVLVDADFRWGGVSAAFGLPSGPGLSNVLSGSCTLQQALIRVEQFPNLYVLSRGTGSANAQELLDSDRWTSLCSTLREHFSFVIVDAPPVAAVADYELIQAECDGVILVIRPDHTNRTLLSTALDCIPDGKRLGVVVNCAAEWFLWKTHEQY